MSLDYVRFVRGGAQITVGAGGSHTITFTGTLREVSVGEWLNPLIQSVHTAAIARSFTEVVIDIRELEYANAAMWTCLVGWLRLLRNDRAATYNLRIRSDTRHRWQQVGMPTLVVFGADRLIVDKEPPGRLP